MWNILNKGAVLWTLGGALFFLIGLFYTHPEKLKPLSISTPSLFVPTLDISGTGVDVIIEQGNANSFYRGGLVDSVGTTTKLYVSPTQKLDINISGTGVSIAIDRRIAPHISFSNNGIGVEIYEY